MIDATRSDEVATETSLSNGASNDSSAKTTVARQLSAGMSQFANRLFAWMSTGAGIAILLVLGAVLAFLVYQGLPAFQATGAELSSHLSTAGKAGSMWAYIGPLAFGTVLISLVALVIATPISVGIALFTSHFAPRKLAGTLGYLVDLLAAVPSVVYGLWGGLWLLPKVAPIWEFLGTVFPWIPFFSGPAASPPRVALTAGMILAVMILPIITALCREVFLQTPRLHEEAALAMGATRWEMIKMAVLPFGRSGIISAAMLGLGRALGETMAVLMILSPGMTYSLSLLLAGKHQTIAANIAAQFPESDPQGVQILIGTGLALFVITFGVNMLARWIVARRADFSGAN